MLNFDCGVYAITSPSGKQYIGSAASFKIRWRYHKWLLRTKQHHCPGLQRAANKYGMDALVFCKIAIVPREDLIPHEQAQINARPKAKLYNANPVAHSCAGRVLTADHRAKIAAAHTGKIMGPMPAEHRAKIAAAHTGRVRSSEHAAKLSAALRGRTLSDEQRAKLSAAHKGKTLSAAHRAKIAAAAGKGRKLSAETRAKISATKRAKRYSL